MSQAITRCPTCNTSFRITEAQLLAAEGSVRCGACMYVFQAEDYFVSPMLDVTELLAIEADYWRDFEDYVEQVHWSPPTDPQESGSDLPLPDIIAEQEDKTDEDKFEAVNVPIVIAEFQPPRTLISFTEPDVEESGTDDWREGSATSLPGAGAPVKFWDPMVTEINDWQSASTGVQYWVPDSEREFEASSETISSETITSETIASETIAVSFWEPGTELPHAQAYNALKAAPLESAFKSPLEEITGSVFGDEIPEVEVPSLAIQVDGSDDFELEDRRKLVSLAPLKWLPGVLVMMATSFMLYAYNEIGVFSQDLKYRHYYETACRYLMCEVPEYYNLEELTTRELIVRTHPEYDSALVADVLLKNSADYRQVFPGLRLQFFDIDGEVVAQRTFQVKDYLGGEMRGLRFIPARTEVRLSLEIVDPGDQALGYQMDVVSFAASR